MIRRCDDNLIAAVREGQSFDALHVFTGADTAAADGHHFSPFRINVFVNGTNIRTIPFETISHRDEAAYLGSTAFTDALLYRRPDSLYLGKIILNRGKTDLLITARDITGNEKAERCTLQVD